MNKKRLRFVLFTLIAIVFVTGSLGACFAPASSEPVPVVINPVPEFAPEPAPPIEIDPLPEYSAWLPLTGEGVDENDARLSLRPLSVKIQNTPEARPYMGLTYADVVYETITEGGITRFNGIFHSTIPDELGSIRSGRNSDVTIVPQYNGLFVFSGSNSTVLSQLAAAIPNRISEGNAGASFFRTTHRPAPHNLYFYPNIGYERFTELGADIYTDNPKALMFGKNDLESLGASKATEVFVPFSAPIFDVTWKYDSEEGAYYRFIQDEAQVDEGDSLRQSRAENIVVVSAPYSSNGDGLTLALNMNGEIDAILFQDGMCLNVTYYTDGTHPPRLKDSSGKEVFFKPGQTWFQVPGDIDDVEVN